MYECPNCGGNLKFDISSQMLACLSCDTKLDPYTYQKDHDAIEDSSFDVTTFTCPQCGGEIYSSDDTAAAFCSFCGSSTILDSRISREKKPKYIIPFQKTKQDCKKSYLNMMRFALFAPSELKDPEYIDSFRGIYMPYWSYNISNKGHISLPGQKSRRRGDYIITKHFALEGDLDAGYEGISYDASSSFYDSISEAIAPFDLLQQKPFTPSYLSGFYADTSDISSDTYESEARAHAADLTYSKVKRNRIFSKYKLNLPSGNREWPLCTSCDQIDNVMYPVWFLAYRNKDRIAYATVNGQTGKVAADLPADPKKFVLGSLLISVPIFILLNIYLTLKPTTVFLFAGILALIAAFLYWRELSQIVKREQYQNDKGILAKKRLLRLNAPLTENEINEWEKKKAQSQKRQKKGMLSSLTKSLSSVIIIVVLSQLFPLILLAGIMLGSVVIWLLLLIAACVITFLSFRKRRLLNKTLDFPFYLGSVAAILIGTLITYLNPVSDLYYYGGAMLSLLAVCFTMLDLIRYYNMLATRKLPQFNRTGGDDRA